MDERQTSFLRHVQLYFEESILTDTTLTCKGARFEVHRFVLACHSEFFLNAFRSEWNEAKPGTMDLSEDEPGIIQALVEYVYHLDYTCFPDTGDIYTLLFHAKVFKLADKYDIYHLRKLALARVKSIDLNYLLFPVVADLIRMAYAPGTHTSELRQELLNAIIPTILTLQVDPDFQDLYMTMPEFARDIVNETTRSRKTFLPLE
ncbi:hypothetical protein LOZ53_005262 [Ophidiomyces ophidiicola]|uniref:Uncharacterized protein n=1 Tax=Ophidiomyces ophidiicola TaxID=1387563 RepID=A0ACB8V4H7_9EURO|nr:uncharacterized protein LOZ57_003237 [Ophidiomyces ophidiicola]KAI1946633.1 hypothetical protein LOZ62_003219 [Ophidiomyces ophidiicola]KAI1947508.1 hypothetical protein LOZ57_003237 [Ophidiomyces ophidiicola]KAI1972894.1 hypothetical protein LOZ55_005631 [Ophidiomyces ophidiicola]KAI1975450.1 hypothetical protein LOZ56_000649 [Ophidiomyces ophidiicola]KAI1981771.1 hypothetical protein LOZ54_005514 [Ophidiomyces ophidiicola]